MIKAKNISTFYLGYGIILGFLVTFGCIINLNDKNLHGRVPLKALKKKQKPIVRYKVNQKEVPLAEIRFCKNFCVINSGLCAEYKPHKIGV